MKSRTAFKALGTGLLVSALAFSLNIGAKKEAFAINPAKESCVTKYVAEIGDNLKQKVEDQYHLTVKIRNEKGEYIENADIQWLAYMDGAGPVNKEDVIYQEETGTYLLSVPLNCEYVLFISAEGYEPKTIEDVKINGIEIVLNKK